MPGETSAAGHVEHLPDVVLRRAEAVVLGGEERYMTVEAPLRSGGGRTPIQRDVEVRKMPERPVAPLDDLVQVRGIGKPAEPLDKRPARRLIVRKGNLQRRTELHASHLHAGGAHTIERQDRVFVFDGEVTAIHADADVFAKVCLRGG
jgi:hypothetical protein